MHPTSFLKSNLPGSRAIITIGCSYELSQEGGAMSHDLPAIAVRLRRAGYRMTPQRQLILDAVCDLGGHVAPEQVYEHVQNTAPTLNRATVYRALSFLTEQRIITATQRSPGRLCYEIPSREPHHHLVCRRCGKSIVLPNTTLKKLVEAVETRHGFRIDMDHISFFGHCSRCRRNEKRETESGPPAR